MADITINDAPLIDSLLGTEKIPISDGSNTPKTITTELIYDYIIGDIALILDLINGDTLIQEAINIVNEINGL